MDTSSPSPPSPSVPKSLLEKYTGCQVLTHLVQAGSKVGDNYIGVVYSVTAEVIPQGRSEKETRHYIIKCYPSHPSRQVYLNKTNLFHQELLFYTSFIKEMAKFQKNILKEDELIQLPVPECQGGKTIDYRKHPEEISNTCQPIDNFIMMTDLKKTFGYEMKDKKAGLDLDHVVLVVKELATLHALSWAYQKHKGASLLEAFAFLKNVMTYEDKEVWAKVLDSNLDSAINSLDSALGSGNKFSKSMYTYKKETMKLIGLFVDRDDNSEKELWDLHREPPKNLVEETEADEPWRVVCHGDAWTNNMVFKYDKSGKPDNVILLDFQMCQISCPTADLVYMIYSSTTRELREKHLETVLQLYHDRFIQVCSTMKVKPLPGFNMETLKRKYHCSLPLGFATVIFLLPILTKEEGNEVNLEETDASTNMDGMYIDALKTDGNDIFKEKILSMSEELYDMGVI